MPVIAHSSDTIDSGTLRCLKIVESGARAAAASSAFAAIVAGSRMMNHMNTATISPGRPTMKNTFRQDVTSSS